MATLTTPKYGFPYPDGTERVMDGDNAMGALANAVDAALSSLVAGINAARLTANYTLTATPTALAGTTVIYNTTVPELALCFAVFDFSVTTAPLQCVGRVYVDGVANPHDAAWGPVGIERSTVPCIAASAPLSPGSHTIELRVHKGAGAGVALAVANSTNLHFVRFRIPTALLAELREAE